MTGRRPARSSVLPAVLTVVLCVVLAACGADDEPDTVTVPDLVGSAVVDARQVVEQAGLALEELRPDDPGLDVGQQEPEDGTIDPTPDATDDPVTWVVATQDPPAGAEVGAGTVVTVELDPVLDEPAGDAGGDPDEDLVDPDDDTAGDA